jgi:hypothetical protein
MGQMLEPSTTKGKLPARRGSADAGYSGTFLSNKMRKAVTLGVS